MAGRGGRRLRGSEREANARGVLREWRESGLSQVAFCRRAGITTQTLRRWRQEFGEGGDGPPGGFVEVRLRSAPGGASFEIDLASGRRLRVLAGFDPRDLERLLAVLDRGTC